MNMQCGWSSSAICHHCYATQQDYVSVPSTLHTAARRSLQNFVTDCACSNCALHSRAYLKLKLGLGILSTSAVLGLVC